jgi:hypothetical protein
VKDEKEIAVAFYRAAARYMIAGFADQNNLHEDISDWIISLGIDPESSIKMRENHRRIAEGVKIEMKKFIEDQSISLVIEMLIDLIETSKSENK